MLGFTPNRSLQKLSKPMYARLVVSFRLRLAQFGLSGCYQPEEILSEAVLRLEHARKLGKDVYNEEAWLRKTGFLYILEMRRNEGKFTTINIDVDSLFKSACILSLHSTEIDHLETQETYQLLNTSIQELQAGERELLVMRFYKNMSWNQIARTHASKGETISVTTLRQRGSRAVKSLRKVYLGKMQLLLPDEPNIPNT
jgi:RNA polymerase sigma factor (sigma-70 family)